ncbi:MAG: PAS domain S-box protein [Deltaproteobacteria bacterium]|nr:PAS domain S-box protein [Deltaproteobacteria bacterium]
MSSLLESHLAPFSPEQRRTAENRPCWELFKCANVLCPNHGKALLECWLIPKAHCANLVIDDFYHKLACCLGCSYFKARSEFYGKGWNDFVAEQLQHHHKSTLERIYAKEESFIEILNRLPDGLFTTDHEWRITYFNPAAEKITGFSAQDAVGMYCKDVFKNTICEYDCALKRAVTEGQDIHNREYEITNIDGERIPIICSTSAFRNPSGEITGGLEVFKDITELKRLQKEVVKRERMYRRVFEGSHDMIYNTNLEGKIMNINQAGVELMGYKSKADLLSRLSAEDLYRDPADRKKFLAAITRNGFVKDYAAEFKKRDGSRLHVLISSRMYENAKTGEVEFEGIIKDITHRKQNEEIISQRNRELSIVNSIAVALNHTMDLKHILTATLKKVIQVLRLERGGLFLIDPEAKKIRLQARFNIPEAAYEEGYEIVFNDTLLLKHLIEENTGLPPEATFPSFQIRYRATGSQTNLGLTCFLITFKGRAIGFFGLSIPKDRVLSFHEIHLMGSLGNFLGGAVENTQMMGTIRKHRQELRQLTGKLFQSQEEERRRIARELHDEAGQSLTAVKLGLDRLEEKHAANDNLKEEIGEIRQMIQRTASEIRRMSYHLHPTLLSDLGLEPALKLYFKEIEKHSNLDIDFQIIGFDRRIGADMETVLYRFSQEALTNTLKHSGAESFNLAIIKSYPRIIFLVEDDGIGFDAEIIGKDKRSLGLLGMRERASLLNGTFILRSSPGDGTRIRIEIPLAEESRHE